MARMAVRSRVARPRQGLVGAAATVGAVVAGAALLEAALIPGLAIGAAAVLAPRLLPNVLPQLRRGLRPLFASPVRRPASAPPQPAPLAAPAGFVIRQAVAKTITFRIIVTTLDFSANYLVLGELGTAAGLSAFALVVGPVFYFVHEAAWDTLGPPVARNDGLLGVAVALPAPAAGRKGFTVSRAVAKTITFRTIATAMDFTANFVVVGDLATAATLSAFGFFAGPFVYLGHEMAWDHFSAPRAPPAPAPTVLLPGPGAVALQ